MLDRAAGWLLLILLEVRTWWMGAGWSFSTNQAVQASHGGCTRFWPLLSCLVIREQSLQRRNCLLKVGESKVFFAHLSSINWFVRRKGDRWWSNIGHVPGDFVLMTLFILTATWVKSCRAGERWSSGSSGCLHSAGKMRVTDLMQFTAPAREKRQKHLTSVLNAECTDDLQRSVNDFKSY